LTGATTFAYPRPASSKGSQGSTRGHNAYLFTSSGNDAFYGTPTFSYIAGANYLNDAINENAVYVYVNASQIAYLFDGAGCNSFIGTASYSYLVGANHVNDAIGFKSVTAYKTNGSTDTAVLYDTPGNDTFTGQGSIGTLTTPSVSYGVAGLGSGDNFGIVSSQGGFDQAFISSILYTLTESVPWH
jgi:hypothetical protein